MDAHYQGFWNEEMMRNYWWMLYHDDPVMYTKESHMLNIFKCHNHSCPLFLILFSESTNSVIS